MGFSQSANKTYLALLNEKFSLHLKSGLLMDFCGFFAQVDELLKDKAVAMDLEVNLKWITIHQAVNSTDDVLVRDKRLVESVEFLLQEFQKNPALSVDYLRSSAMSLSRFRL